MKVKKLLTTKHVNVRIISPISVVEPSQEMTIKEILINFSNGERVEQKQYEPTYGEDYQDIDLDVLDPVDRLAIQQDFERRYNNALLAKKAREDYAKKLKELETNNVTNE